MYIAPLFVNSLFMKKTIALLTISALFLGGNTAYASTSTDQLIAQLQQQIASLTARLTELKQAKNNVVTAEQGVSDTLLQLENLSEGMSNDQVALLQATLANDESIYPEGKVTGFYGKLTTVALKRFQKKNGLPQSGVLDTATVALLNQALAQSSIGREDDDSDHNKLRGKKRFCISGVEVKMGNKGKHRGWEKMNLARCKRNPGNNGGGTTIPDTTPPVVSAITVSGISASGASVSWTTNENTTSKLYVSTTSPVPTSTATWSDGTRRLTHLDSVGSLAANTTYYFVVEATDASGNKTTSAQGSFSTTNVVVTDTTAPTISAIAVGSITAGGATITWVTNENTTSKLYVSTSTTVSTSSATWTDAVLLGLHSAGVAGLAANTSYNFVIEANDGSGNKTLSAQGSFSTLVAPDVISPIVTSFSVAPTGSTTGIAQWTTNETASSRVYYSTSSPVNKAVAPSFFDASLSLSHNLILSGLSASTTYFLVAESKDVATNTGLSSESSFTTAP